MKKIFCIILIIAALIAAAFLLHNIWSGPGKGPPGGEPGVIINPTPDQAKAAANNYNLKAEAKVAKKAIDDLKPGQSQTVTGNIILTDKKTGTETITQTPATVSKDQDDNIIFTTSTDIAVTDPPESPWKIIVAHEGDIGLGYELMGPQNGTRLLFDFDTDVFLTQRRAGVGVSKKFKFVYAGIGESYDFRDEKFEPVVYVGGKIGF